MAQTLVMPKLGLTMTEGTIVKWLKVEGEAVAVGDALYEVETDKLTNTIESAVEGTLLKIAVGEGDTADCLAPVAYVGQPGEIVETVAAEKPAAEAPAGAPAAEVQKPAAATGGRVSASPAAKRLAREKGIDLSQVAPAQPGERISLSDVEAFLARPAVRASGLAKKVASDKGIDLADVPAKGRVMAADVAAYAADGLSPAPEEIVPMTGMRKVIAKRMRESQDISPTVAYDISVDMTAMKAVKSDLAAEGVKVSYTDLLVKIAARLLLEFPLLNCSVDGESLIYRQYVNMGVAVALPDGLLVPVVKDAHRKGLSAISQEIKALASDARSGSLGPDSLTGGTFTVTNLGMYGIESFTPIINQPEVAILGANAMQDSPVVVDGQIVVRPIMKLSLVADHRAVDGAVAAQFLAKLKKTLEKPALLLV